jgi:hypothetical protein
MRTNRPVDGSGTNRGPHCCACAQSMAQRSRIAAANEVFNFDKDSSSQVGILGMSVRVRSGPCTRSRPLRHPIAPTAFQSTDSPRRHHEAAGRHGADTSAIRIHPPTIVSPFLTPTAASPTEIAAIASAPTPVIAIGRARRRAIYRTIRHVIAVVSTVRHAAPIVRGAVVAVAIFAGIPSVSLSRSRSSQDDKHKNRKDDSHRSSLIKRPPLWGNRGRPKSGIVGR